jgi:hypothetical protein
VTSSFFFTFKKSNEPPLSFQNRKTCELLPQKAPGFYPTTYFDISNFKALFCRLKIFHFETQESIILSSTMFQFPVLMVFLSPDFRILTTVRCIRKNSSCDRTSYTSRQSGNFISTNKMLKIDFISTWNNDVASTSDFRKSFISKLFPKFSKRQLDIFSKFTFDNF